MAGRCLLIAWVLTAWVLILVAAPIQAQTQEELRQARAELTEKYAAAAEELQVLVTELPEVVADTAGLAKKEAYVDRVFALRSDLEILKADLDFLDFRLAGAGGAAASHAVVEGDRYVLTEANDAAGKALTESGFTDRPNGGFGFASFSFDVPSVILIGQPISFGGSAQYTSDCLTIEMMEEGNRTGLNPGFLKYLIGTSVHFRLGSGADEVVFAGWRSSHKVPCNHNPDPPEYTGGVQSSRTSLHVTLKPDPTLGDEGYRYAASYTADGLESNGTETVRIGTSGIIVIEVNGIDKKAFFIYRREPAPGPVTLDPFEHPDAFVGTVAVGDLSQSGADEAVPAGTTTAGATAAGTAATGAAATGTVAGATPVTASNADIQGPKISDYPDAVALIEEWLRVAEPPQNATEGADLRYDPYGRLEGTTMTGTITLSGRPDDAGSQPSIEYVWARADDLDSVDHCTLNEYVEMSINGGSLAYCMGRYLPERVPDVTGNPIHIAVNQMAEAGLTPELVAGDPAPVPELEGTIQAVGPLRGDKIVLTVFTQPEGANVVPDLTGIHLRDAQSILSDAGFEMRPELGDPASEPELEGQIYRQNPPGGTTAQANSVVSVFVYGPVPATVEATAALERILVPAEIGETSLAAVWIKDISEFAAPIRSEFGFDRYETIKIPASRFKLEDGRYSVELPTQGWPWHWTAPLPENANGTHGHTTRISLVYGKLKVRWDLVLHLNWDSADLAEHPSGGHYTDNFRGNRPCHPSAKPEYLQRERYFLDSAKSVVYFRSPSHFAYVEMAVYETGLRIPWSVLETSAFSIIDQLETNADLCVK